jgi:hypothetical protein
MFGRAVGGEVQITILSSLGVPLRPSGNSLVCFPPGCPRGPRGEALSLGLMRPISHLLVLTGILAWIGCDAADPTSEAGRTSSFAGSATSTTYIVSGSVFVNDVDDVTPEESRQREPGELGIQHVRVDVIAPGHHVPFKSVLTKIDGRYQLSLPAGEWVLRVTSAPSARAFNPTLFASYTPAGGAPERSVNVQSNRDGVDFGFDPNLTAILRDLTEGEFRTDARSLEVWRRWVNQAFWHPVCAEVPDRICRNELNQLAHSIFARPGAQNGFLGNRVPFLLPPGVTPLAEARRILNERPSTDEGLLVQELLVMEFNFLAGFGGPDPIYDRTLIYYLEEYVVGIGAVSSLAVGRTTSEKSSGAILLQLEIARAYNLGGGGGGETGD